MPKESQDIIAFGSDSVERNRELGFPDLEEQKKAFAIKYVTNGYLHRQAAADSGFPLSRGIRLKREPLVAAYISDLMNKYLAESLVTKQTLDIYLDELEDIAMGRVDVPMITGNGDEIEARKFHPDLAMKVYSERSKLHGIVKDENNGSGVVNVQINMNSLTGEVRVITPNE